MLRVLKAKPFNLLFITLDMDPYDKPEKSSVSIDGYIANLQSTLTLLKDTPVWHDSLPDVFSILCEQLKSIPGLLASVFTLDVPVEQISDQLIWLQSNKEDYLSLASSVDQIDSILSHFLDEIDAQRSNVEQRSYDLVLTSIEKCTQFVGEKEIWLRASKSILDASLEYNEILKDHIETLENVIETNTELCFEIQEDKFSSPVRHPPSFTLKQLIKLLSTNAEGSEVKLPTFSVIEETLYKKFLALKHSIPPIEKSLTEILPERINDFGKRDIPNIAHITSLLEEKKRKLLSKYRFMVDEVRELKIELIDNRWSVLFRNLNHELSSLLDDIEALQSKISNFDGSLTIKTKLREQLEKKSKTVTKTFNVTYKALEFSLLEPEVASQTNALAKKWLDIRPNSDQILAKAKSEEDDIQSLSQRLQELTMRSNTRPADVALTHRSNFGAFLHKKMNIRPVIVKGTPMSAEKVNPIYQRSPLKAKSNSVEGLILKTAPLLSYSVQQSSSENLFDTPEGSSGLTSRSLESLEYEKMSFYSKQQSRIPVLSATALPIAMARSPSINSTQQWTPYRLRGRSLRQPTPRAVLLSAGLM